jgi:hypothetical protein
MTATSCSQCGAPLVLVEGRCSHCGAVHDHDQAAGLIVDGRGPVWRLRVVGIRDAEGVVKHLVKELGWDEVRASALVQQVQQGNPAAIMERVHGRQVTDAFLPLHHAGAEASQERWTGATWEVAVSSETMRTFAAEHGMESFVEKPKPGLLRRLFGR